MNTIEPDDRGLVRVCAQCGQRNRLIYERLGSIFRCSKCHAEISPPTEPVEVPGVAKFDSLVARSALPVLVDFWAPWCGPCVEYLRNVCGINLPGIKMILELVNEAERLRSKCVSCADEAAAARFFEPLFGDGGNVSARRHGFNNHGAL